jgi:hypothetical protein
MNRAQEEFMWKSILSCAMTAVTFVLGGAAALGAAPVPIPQFTGPVPVTAASYPYLADDHEAKPLDLQTSGYMEEEFIVSGSANVYAWSRSGAAGITRNA